MAKIALYNNTKIHTILDTVSLRLVSQLSSSNSTRSSHRIRCRAVAIGLDLVKLLMHIASQPFAANNSYMYLCNEKSVAAAAATSGH